LPLLPQNLRLLTLSSTSINCIPNKPNSLSILGIEYGQNVPNSLSLNVCDESFNPSGCQLVTSVSDTKFNEASILYPNPATSEITVNVIGTEEISIYNTTGTLMLQKQISDRQKINIDALMAGLYLYTIGGKQGKLVIK
jgi:hypothetical protein